MPSAPPAVKTFPLRDAVAVVTGAAGGLGAAIARSLAAQGTHLALVDVDAAGLAATAAALRTSRPQLTITEHVLDVADRDAVKALPAAVLATHDRVSIVVNNAGVAIGGRFIDTPEADFDWLMGINFGGTVAMTRAFLPVLAREPVAQLVNVSSLFGLLAPPGQSAYAASKFAVRGFSESLRHELEHDGSPVGITLVHPGGVRTGIARNARISAPVSAEELASAQAAWTDLLRLDPDRAAARIVQGLQRREKRVLVGIDAIAGSWLQRLMPVGYWRHIQRDIERRTRRSGGSLSGAAR